MRRCYCKKVYIRGHKTAINLVIKKLKNYIGFTSFFQTLSFLIIFLLSLVILNVFLNIHRILSNLINPLNYYALRIIQQTQQKSTGNN